MQLDSGCLCFFDFFLGNESQQDGAGHENGRVRTDADTDEQSKGEVMDDAASEEEQTQDDQQCGQRGHDCSAQSLVDAGVDNISEAQFLVDLGAEVFTNPVEDDDGVVERVTDNGQQRRNDGQIEFFVQE